MPITSARPKCLRMAPSRYSVRPPSMRGSSIASIPLSLAVTEAFEALDLAPVAPFGTCAVLSGIDQNNVLSALRRAEVVADPTAALALAAAARRRSPAARRSGWVRLCASTRVVRMQSLAGAPPGYTPHFRLFALGTAGRDAREHRFETDTLGRCMPGYLARWRSGSIAFVNACSRPSLQHFPGRRSDSTCHASRGSATTAGSRSGSRSTALRARCRSSTVGSPLGRRRSSRIERSGSSRARSGLS